MLVFIIDENGIHAPGIVRSVWFAGIQQQFIAEQHAEYLVDLVFLRNRVYGCHRSCSCSMQHSSLQLHTVDGLLFLRDSPG
jgi:hypothetical protein